MSKKNTSIIYSALLILSTTKRSFSAIGRLIQKSRDTVRRFLQPKEVVLELAHTIAKTAILVFSLVLFIKFFIVGWKVFILIIPLSKNIIVTRNENKKNII